MIQRPEHDEIIVGVPSAGTLLDHHRALQGVFEQMLAKGHEERRDGQAVIVWHVEGREPVSAADPAFAAAIARLERCAERAVSGARELRAALAANPKAPDVEVGPVVSGLLRSRSADGRPPRIARAKAEELEQVLARGAKAVRHALSTPRLYGDERGICLAGWGFLPPRAIVEEPFVLRPNAPGPEVIEPPGDPGVLVGSAPAPDPPPAAPPLPPRTQPQPVPERVIEPARRGMHWWLAALAAIALLCLFLVLWLLFPGQAVSGPLDPMLVSPSGTTMPMARSDEDRRRGTVDVELPPLPKRRELIYAKPKRSGEQ